MNDHGKNRVILGSRLETSSASRGDGGIGMFIAGVFVSEYAGWLG